LKKTFKGIKGFGKLKERKIEDEEIIQEIK
jgi:hypothetical protein